MYYTRIMDNCIIWTGPISGMYGVDGGFLAHRRAWERWNKQKVPVGMLVHHTCETTLCVNPEHLVAMSHSEHKRLHPNLKWHSNKPRQERRRTPITEPELREVLQATDGNKRQAAARLNITRPTLYSLIDKFGIQFSKSVSN
jgi:DNA-binding NtrC family response regulator